MGSALCMRYFISTGEPSGDLHAGNLVRRIRSLDPSAEFSGLGGNNLTAAGCPLIHPLADDPIMGFVNAIRAVPKLLGVLARVKEEWRRNRPDVVVTIDYPGFHWHLAKAAKKMGLPVVYFIPPQIWSWAPWRVAKVRKFFELVLCSLPFEPAWYDARGVPFAEFVGHPFFDDLSEHRPDPTRVEELRSGAGPTVAILPGSRSFEIRNNTDVLLSAAAKVAARIPSARFHIAGYRPDHAETIRGKLAGSSLPIDVHVGRTREILAAADVALSVSGSVSLELLEHRLPSVIVYRLQRRFMEYVLKPLFLKAKYITLVNLMADRIVYPEFVGCADRSTEMADQIVNWLERPLERQRVVGELDELRRRFAMPGATAAAAERIVAHTRGANRRRAAA
jgi:lipid-A-disaccharide synthase